jgi:hypothetical protein
MLYIIALHASYNIIYNLKMYLQASLDAKDDEVDGQPTLLPPHPMKLPVGWVNTYNALGEPTGDQ